MLGLDIKGGADRNGRVNVSIILREECCARRIVVIGRAIQGAQLLIPPFSNTEIVQIRLRRLAILP